MVTHVNSAALLQGNLNLRPVHFQDQALQKAQVSAPAFLENPQQLEAWDGGGLEQSVAAPVRHPVEAAGKVDDGGAGHSAHGVEGTAEREREEGKSGRF